MIDLDELEPLPYGLHAMDNLDGFSRLDDEVANVIMADGPYFISTKEEVDERGSDNKRGVVNFGEWDKGTTVEMMDTTIAECYRTLRPDGSLIWWTGWEALGDLKKILTRHGFTVRRKLTWVKPTGNIIMSGVGFLQFDENALWATKGRTIHSHRFIPLGPEAPRNWVSGVPPRGDRRIHNCQKPMDVYKYFLQRFIRPLSEDLIVEPFAGSAPCYGIAQEWGCRYYGFEQSEEACKKALEYHHGR